MDEKIERLVRWSKGEKAPPLTLELSVTNKCNLLCKMCWLRSTKPAYNEMSDEELLRIVEEAIELGVKEFRFPGSGEPLMRKDVLFKLMERIKENECNGLLISNCTLFSEQDIKQLIAMEWDILTVSLDGPSPAINDYIRGVKGSFKRVIKTLDLIKKWKGKLKKEKPWLRMNIVLTNKNFDKLEEMIVLAKKYDFKEVLLQPMTIFSEEGRKLQVKDTEIIEKYLKRAINEAENFKIKTNMNSFIRNMIIENTNQMEKMIEEEIKNFGNGFLASVCFEPFYNLVIMANGKAKPCAIAGGKAEVDIRGKNLKEVWFGKIFERFRRNLLNGRLFPFCSHCCVPVFLENKRLRRELIKVV
jgi:MoaA/NifB/PqqE/SkfB family radical SAM enzyme